MGVMQSLGRGVLKLHQAAYERTNGRLGHRFLGMSTLLLRTTGRRSGKVRSNALASNGGADRPPGWLFNVRTQADVDLQVAEKHFAGRGRVLERGEEGYERLWRLVNDENSRRYDGYQAKTERPIPLVIVTPR